MRKFFYILIISITLLGCAKDNVVVEDQVNYGHFSPGFTGYSTGFDGYGDYNDGYGPSFWNSRFKFNADYSSGYLKDGY